MRDVLPVPYGWLRPFLFRMNPERAHGWAQDWIRKAGTSRARLESLRARTLPSELEERLHIDVLGLRFPSPVGLAAGFDKGEVLGPGLFALGFGSVEIGTITPRPQSGNPRPRLFRIPSAEALINRMGFNNEGAAETARRLAAWPADTRTGPVGVNIGKNKDTPLAKATDDYLAALEPLEAHADYVVVNVSSPNTPGLRELQEPAALRALLSAVVGACDRPVLVKIDPDLEDRAVEQAVDVAGEAGCAGIIATNTTVGRPGVNGRIASEKGGLSGRPLGERALEVLKRVYARAQPDMVCFGVGGVDSGAAAYERIRAGARIVQVYTGMIYRGPMFAAELNRDIAARLDADGFDTLGDAVGTAD